MTKRIIQMVASLCALLLSTGDLGAAVQHRSNLTVKAMLVDSELNLRPVPKHVLFLRSKRPGVEPLRIVLGLDGTVSTQVSPGEYDLVSESAVTFQGKSYRWEVRVTVPEASNAIVELSIDNADIGIEPGRIPANVGLPQLFREWQDSVVTVWSETGHGSGFLIDADGLRTPVSSGAGES